MSDQCYVPVKLPDITIIGGDSTDWSFSLVRKNGATFYIDQSAECTATLTVIPFDMVVSSDGYINAPQAVLQKTAEFCATSFGGTEAVFHFFEADTKNLCGKFIYQVEVRHDDESRVGQGNLYIHYNINQGSD